jgi:uncharacterized membrane protein
MSYFNITSKLTITFTISFVHTASLIMAWKVFWVQDVVPFVDDSTHIWFCSHSHAHQKPASFYSGSRLDIFSVVLKTLG